MRMPWRLLLVAALAATTVPADAAGTAPKVTPAATCGAGSLPE